MTDPTALGGGRGPAWRVLSLVVIAACGLGQPAATSPPATSPGEAVVTTDRPAPISTTTASDPRELVARAVAATAPNYRFASTMVAEGVEVTSITGTVDGPSMAATIKTGTSAIEYVITPEGEWATGEEGDLVPIEGEPPAVAPLAALMELQEVVVASMAGDQVTVNAILGPSAGPAAGLQVAITIAGEVISRIEYQAEVAGVLAEVVTVLTDVGSAGTVSPPPA
jgi:hypothetical protein